jgi:uncharacterized membrane protein affecting hemolysin expression
MDVVIDTDNEEIITIAPSVQNFFRLALQTHKNAISQEDLLKVESYFNSMVMLILGVVIYIKIS